MCKWQTDSKETDGKIKIIKSHGVNDATVPSNGRSGTTGQLLEDV